MREQSGGVEEGEGEGGSRGEEIDGGRDRWGKAGE